MYRCKKTNKTVSVLENFDVHNGIPQSSYHTRRSSAKDIGKVVQQLTQTFKVFENHTGRKQQTFPNLQQNLMHTVCLPT